MTWTHNKEYDFEQIKGKSCQITLEKRPGYCDRGNFIAKISPLDLEMTMTPEMLHAWVRLGIDHSDGWPRYYFDEGRAKAEIEAWLVKRKEAIE